MQRLISQDRFQGKSSSMQQYQRISRDIEQQICDWALAVAAQGEPPTYMQIVRYASCVLKESGDTKPLGKNWINGFVRRYPSINFSKSKATEGRPKVLFWQSTNMDEENSERARKSLQAFINTLILTGLPKHLVGVRSRSETESSMDDDDPPLIMACREACGTGMTTLSTDHLRALREEYNRAESSWINFAEALPHGTSKSSLPKRVICDPGHSNIEWSIFENITMSLTELALDPNGVPRPIFRKALDISGKVKSECKSNNEIEREQLGSIVGRTWFMRPLVPTLNIDSAVFVYNQIKLLVPEFDERDNILPWIFVKTHVGPFPTTIWTRYISSHRGEAHMQFHAQYITPDPTSTTQLSKFYDGDGFCILREKYPLGGSGAFLSEGRVSIAMKTATDVSQLYYSAVTLADSGAFQEGVSGELWDEKFVPPNCGSFTGIAVFQAMLYHTIQLCGEEHKKTARTISDGLRPSDQINVSEAGRLIKVVLRIVRQTTEGIIRLADDCRATLKGIVEQAEDDRATQDNVVIEKRWDSLISSQQKIEEELPSIFPQACDG